MATRWYIKQLPENSGLNYKFMIFNTTDNRTKFDRLKRSTSNISVPFNAGRRTGFKATASASDIRMEDWITSKIAAGSIATSSPTTTDTELFSKILLVTQ